MIVCFIEVHPFNFRIFLSVERVACWSHSVVVQNVPGFAIKAMIASEYNLVYSYTVNCLDSYCCIKMTCTKSCFVS